MGESMFDKLSEKDKKNFILALICVGVTAVVYFVFKYILILVAPFLLGIIFTLMIKRPVLFLHKRLHLPILIGTLISITVVVGIIICALSYVGGKFVIELKSFMTSYDFYYNKFICELNNTCCSIDETFGMEKGITFSAVESNLSSTISKTSENIIPSVFHRLKGWFSNVVLGFTAIFIAITAIFFLVKDIDKMILWARNGPASKWLRIAFGRLSHYGSAYIKTQCIIMSITAAVCTLALFMINNSYPFMIGILIGIMDALPILGTGTVLVPWIILLFVSKKIYKAIVLVAAYIICYIVRQFLEPKLMGNQMGIPPLIMLITMYAGFLVFGVLGFLLGPAAYIIITEIMKYFYDILYL